MHRRPRHLVLVRRQPQVADPRKNSRRLLRSSPGSVCSSALPDLPSADLPSPRRRLSHGSVLLSFPTPPSDRHKNAPPFLSPRREPLRGLLTGPEHGRPPAAAVCAPALMAADASEPSALNSVRTSSGAHGRPSTRRIKPFRRLSGAHGRPSPAAAVCMGCASLPEPSLHESARRLLSARPAQARLSGPSFRSFFTSFRRC